MSDETAPQPRIKIAWLIGTLAAFSLFVVIAAYSARMTRDYTDYDKERAQARYETLAKVRHAEELLLAPVDAQGHPTAEWVDQAKGTVRIPIEEAMSRELETLKGQAPQAGCEIPGTVPAPASAATPPSAILPSAGATNAAPAKPAAKTKAKPAAAASATTNLPPAKLNESKP